MSAPSRLSLTLARHAVVVIGLVVSLAACILATRAVAAPSAQATPAAAAGPSLSPTGSLLQQAQDLVGRQELAAAADVYRELRARGLDSAGLRYNLGTLELEQGAVGPAVLHLLAASRDSPSDDDIHHNLAAARMTRVDRLDDDDGGGAAFAHAGARVAPLGARWAFVLAALCFAAACVVAGAMGGARTRSWVLVSGALVVVAGAVLAARLSFETVVTGVVLVEQTEAKKEPDERAASSFTAHAGLDGTVVEDRGTWVRLRLSNGLDAWLPRSALGFVPDDTDGAAPFEMAAPSPASAIAGSP